MKSIFKFSLILLCCFSLSSVTVAGQDLWKLRAEEINETNYYGETVANGMIGIVSSAVPLKSKEIILAGVYDKFGRGRVSNFLPSFNLLDVEMVVNGVRVNKNTITNFRQELDMKSGEFKGCFEIPTVAQVEYTYRALRHLPHNVMLSINVLPYKDGGIAVDNMMSTPVSLREDMHYFNQVSSPFGLVSLLTSVAKTPSQNTTVAASSAFLFSEADKPVVTHHMKDNNMHQTTFMKDLKANQTYRFSIVGSLFSSVQVPDPYNQAERSTIFAVLEGEELLIKKHQEEWSKLWESDILIEGDDEAQLDIRSMLYHLYATMRPKTDFSPSPMGLSGLGYNGHVFWDSEIFMFPPLLFLQPALAESMLSYRFNRLDAAKQIATINGYRGAMYPWESATSGHEETPVWALTGPFEHHITADVAIAAWNYYVVTQDKEWLKSKGWPILENTANFWASRVVLNEVGEYVINNVVAADEWAENVNNNAYTNGAAKRNLEYAELAAKVIGVDYPKEWGVIARKIPIRQLDNGVTSEYDGYAGQNIKQADVNLLAYPLELVTNKEQIEKDLIYYAERVPERDTPAMTQAIFALLYSRMGNTDRAYHWFEDAYKPNKLPPFGVLAETKGGDNPYFLTGAGGILQTVLMGFGGLAVKPNGEVYQKNSVMPKHWKRLTIKGVGKDRKTFVRVNK